MTHGSFANVPDATLEEGRVAHGDGQVDGCGSFLRHNPDGGEVHLLSKLELFKACRQCWRRVASIRRWKVVVTVNIMTIMVMIGIVTVAVTMTVMVIVPIYVTKEALNHGRDNYYVSVPLRRQT